MTSIVLHEGDNIELMRRMPDNSVDSVVTDPPYLLTSINERFGKKGAAPAKFGRDGAFSRTSSGFMGQTWDAPNVEAVIDPGFAYWFSGFADGEGCFTVNRTAKSGCHHCSFAIVVRDDDRAILHECQRQLGGIGVVETGRKTSNPNAGAQARFTVTSKADCQKLRAVLSVFPLRAKKSRDFEIWCHALNAWESREYGDSWDDIAFYREQLQHVKRFGAVFKPDLLFHYRWAYEVFRVLKPGGYCLAFSSPRTGHWQAVAMELAGFVMHPFLGWVYGSGLPKDYDAARVIDKALGVAGGRGDYKTAAHAGSASRVRRGGGGVAIHTRPYMSDPEAMDAQARAYVPGSEEARQWEGWSYGAQALKPALEPIYVGQKPFSEKNGGLNLLKHGAGAINIDGCRVHPGGRHPANLLHDGSADVVALFPDAPGQLARSSSSSETRKNQNVYGEMRRGAPGSEMEPRADAGSAGRFFNAFPMTEADYREMYAAGIIVDLEADVIRYNGKATIRDRVTSCNICGVRAVGAKPDCGCVDPETGRPSHRGHPTVKPIALMRWLVRLVTPPGGTVLDPFAGSGTTGAAAREEGLDCILMEAEAAFAVDIRARLSLDAPPADLSALLGLASVDPLSSLVG